MGNGHLMGHLADWVLLFLAQARIHLPVSNTVGWPCDCVLANRMWAGLKGTTSRSIKTSQAHSSLFGYPFSCWMERTLKTKRRVEPQDGKSQCSWMIIWGRAPSPPCPTSSFPSLSFPSLFLLILPFFFPSSLQPLHQPILDCKQEKQTFIMSNH